MIIFRCSPFLTALALVSLPVHAQEGIRADRILATSTLHERYSASEATEAGRLMIGYCLGAITGIADAAMTLNAVLKGKQAICLPKEANAEAMRLSFLMLVENKPEVKDMPAATVVIALLQSGYPCKELSK